MSKHPTTKIISVQMDQPLLKAIDNVQKHLDGGRSAAIRLLVAHGLKHLKSLRVAP